MSKDSKNLKVFSKSKFHLLGDLDLLTYFGFHNVEKKFM